MNVGIVIPAAGIGHRMGSDRPKQYLAFQGKPLICHTLDCFLRFDTMILAVEPGRESMFQQEILQAYGYPSTWQVVAGGEKRQDSVGNALAVLPKECELVLVHDAVRPFVDDELLDRIIAKAMETGAAIPAIAVTDTIKRVKNNLIENTQDRAVLWRAQTPQAFRVELLQKALAKAKKDGYYGTDEANLVERLGVPVTIVAGSEQNIKITTPADLRLAEYLWRQEC
ncbi:MAG: 2-C-methyl-D-erythritol 4-phosphate cytidylyltransferase [Deltaproteobacteria bacterium]|nr:2-C-methyl-D-erythritol 4-phosphate cytidylyltransferase [Deltaproteobacteria bacterium]